MPPGEGAAVVRSRATVPRGWPAGALRPATVRALNARKYASAPRTERGRPQPLGRHMFPLDSLDAWPRLYGPSGFVQYQLVVPTGAERVLELIIERLRRGRVPCYLAVLKDLGPANGAPLSFPLAGWTLTLDMPRSAPGLEPLLAGLRRHGRRGRRARLPVERRPAAAGDAASDVPAPRRVARRTQPRRSRTILVLGPRSPRGSVVSDALLVGGTSEIGLAIVRRLAAQRVWLLGRDGGRLARAAAELDGAAVEVGLLDADDIPSHRQAIERAFLDAGGFDVVVIAVGALGAQAGLDADPDEAIEIMRVELCRCRVAAARVPSPTAAARRGDAGAAVVGRGRASPRLEPDLRSGQGRTRCACPGSLRRDRVERRARTRRPPRVRQDPDDCQSRARPVRDDAGGGRVSDSRSS